MNVPQHVKMPRQCSRRDICTSFVFKHCCRKQFSSPRCHIYPIARNCSLVSKVWSPPCSWTRRARKWPTGTLSAACTFARDTRSGVWSMSFVPLCGGAAVAAVFFSALLSAALAALVDEKNPPPRIYTRVPFFDERFGVPFYLPRGRPAQSRPAWNFPLARPPTPSSCACVASTPPPPPP